MFLNSDFQFIVYVLKRSTTGELQLGFLDGLSLGCWDEGYSARALDLEHGELGAWSWGHECTYRSLIF